VIFWNHWILTSFCLREICRLSLKIKSIWIFKSYQFDQKLGLMINCMKW